MSFDAIVAHSKMLIGSQITRCALLIWPDQDAPTGTAIQLHLSLSLPSTNTHTVTLSTDADGQTPVIRYEDIEIAYSFSEFPQRLSVWKTDEFWEHATCIEYEGFDIQDSEQFAGIVGTKLLEIGIIVYEENTQKLPTGLHMKCSSGQEIWSVPAAYGNSIWTTLPTEYFIAPVRTYRIR